MKPQIETRWKRRKDDRPTEIMAAALDCFKERGFSATRLDEIASRAGVTKGTLYIYFRSKEDIFKAVVQNFLAARITALGLRVEESRSTEELLRELIAHFLAEVFDTPISVLPKIIITEAGNFPELAKFYYDTVVSNGMQLIASLLKRGIDRGEFRPIDVEHAAHCVIGPLLLGMIWKHTFEVHAGGKLDAAAVCQAHVDLLLHGLLKDQTKGNLS